MIATNMCSNFCGLRCSSVILMQIGLVKFEEILRNYRGKQSTVTF